ncbi:MAG: beta-lactamase [Aquamicrobium sp.]|nr:beta-lactamase [Aquamicrobium sp.]
MRMRKNAFLLFAICLAVNPALANSADREQVAAIVDEAFGSLMRKHQVPGLAVAVTIGGKHHFFNYGVASLETREPVTEHTIFEIGSVSKTFTATLGGYALAMGKLSLEDKPSMYVAELAGSAVDQATLLNLATYTAGGLPLQFPQGVDNDRDAISYIAAWKPESEPGNVRRYSNPSIGLFGHLTAEALGGDFADLLELEVFERLALTHTFVRVPEDSMALYAWGYDAGGRAVRVNPGAFDEEAYGVKSSAADMIAFIDANLHPERLDPIMREAVTATHKGYFEVGEMIQGLGWEQFPFPLTLERLRAGNSRTMAFESNPATPAKHNAHSSHAVLYSKTGSTNGFGAYATFVPEAELGVVMLANMNIFMPDRLEAMHQALEALAELAK